MRLVLAKRVRVRSDAPAPIVHGGRMEAWGGRYPFCSHRLTLCLATGDIAARCSYQASRRLRGILIFISVYLCASVVKIIFCGWRVIFCVSLPVFQF